jgi:hypothetical protein
VREENRGRKEESCDEMKRKRGEPETYIWPLGTGKGRASQPQVMMLRSLRQTPEC